MSDNNIKPSNRATQVESFKVMDVLRRANQLEAEGRTIYHCEVGQPESGAPKTVAQAAVTALTGDANQSRLGYTDAFGLVELREKIAEHYKEKYSLPADKEVGADRIVVTTGSSGGFLLAFTACFDAGDVIAVASSGYPCYRNIGGALGLELANVPINEEFKLTANELRKEVDERKASGKKRIRGVILSSPSNPTGAMLSVTELKDMCELCEKKASGFSLTRSTTVSVMTKKRQLPCHLVDPINTLQQNMFINAPTISQTAAIQCWEPETIAELETHVAKYRKSREFILKQLDSISEIKSIAPADGGFYVYIDLGEELVCRERDWEV
ncbi:aspartate aminotransferase [Skeletonema marinoi]|uniref:Aspartate aminotransferase n=1 Tax=Skeletonema marinoi TaxID=267567 RepID=A0AAD9DDZ0_9STRA|nr:aspartate aminotransferase [Skeletonema marinoi]